MVGSPKIGIFEVRRSSTTVCIPDISSRACPSALFRYLKVESQRVIRELK